MRTEQQNPIAPDLDSKLRGLHVAASQQVSPATLMRLRDARQGLTSHSRDRAFGGAWRWRAAGLGSVALAVAFVLQMVPWTPWTVGPSDTPLAVMPAPADAFDYPASLAALDEDPDLYLWLAAEAGPLQLEQL